MTREDWQELIEEMMVGMLEEIPPERAAYLTAWNDALACYHGVQTGMLTLEQALAVRDGIPPGGVPRATTPKADRITAALDIINRYGGIDGDHHKAWVLDQVVRQLALDYDAWVREHKQGDEGPETYDWNEGVPP